MVGNTRLMVTTMIKHLKVKNYLSLKDLTIDLGLRNVLVGPNMAGKSNIVDIFRFLTHIASTGLMAAINAKGGFSEILWKGVDEGQILISLLGEFFWEENEKRTYEYEIVLAGSTKIGIGTFVVSKESLKRCDSGSEYILAEFQNGKGKGFNEDGSVAFEEKESSIKSFLEYSIPGWEGMVIKRSIIPWHFYSLSSLAMRQVNTVGEQFFLNEHGNNLSAWLLTLQTKYSDEFKRLEQAFKDIIPEILGISSPPTQTGTTFLLMKEKYLKRPTNLWRISDGALQFLAILSLIFAPPELGASLVCIEEPENHLHPKLIESLVELLNQRQQEVGEGRAAQLIVTTHYPYLIDMFSLNDLLAVVKEEGATYCIRPNHKKHLHTLLEQGELSLSDLWYSGALGEE
jgi:predicted ATPase